MYKSPLSLSDYLDIVACLFFIVLYQYFKRLYCYKTIVDFTLLYQYNENKIKIIAFTLKEEKHMEQPLYQEASAAFYRELPVKTCAHCGKEMDEQCESYQTECDECAVTEH